MNLHHRAVVERLLAWARFVAVLAIAIALSTPTSPEHLELSHPVAAAYALYAAVVLVVVLRRPPVHPAIGQSLHALDFAWTTMIFALSGGVSSHVYPLFALLLIGAAFRWGLRRTIIDGAGIVVLSLVESAASLAGLTPWDFHPDLFLLRVSYIVVLAVLFGVVAEGQQALRFQALAIGGLMSRLSENTLVVPAVRELLGELIDVFGASRVALVVHDLDAGAPSLWIKSRDRGGRVSFVRRGLMPYEKEAWLFPIPDRVAACELRRERDRTGAASGRAAVTLVLDSKGASADVVLQVPPHTGEDSDWATTLVAVAVSTPKWNGRFFVFDPTLRPRGYVRLGFLLNLARQAGPPLMNLHLLRRLRLDAATSERGRVARELHDGAIQTLASLEMRLDVLRRGPGAGDPQLASELGELQRLSHNGTAEMRELIGRMRPLDMDGHELKAALTDLVRRFGRDSGIEAAFEWAAGRVEFGYRQSPEVYKLVQEALVNVRRHSEASRVHVRLEADSGGALLIVEDNGKGLGFEGSFTHEQLATGRLGPRVLRERVESMGGVLHARSSAAGTRLELTFPKDDPE